MKLTVNNIYKFNFAGQVLTGRFLSKKTLHDSSIVYRFEYNNCIYPVKKEDICGNLKQ